MIGGSEKETARDDFVVSLYRGPITPFATIVGSKKLGRACLPQKEINHGFQTWEFSGGENVSFRDWDIFCWLTKNTLVFFQREVDENMEGELGNLRCVFFLQIFVWLMGVFVAMFFFFTKMVLVIFCLDISRWRCQLFLVDFLLGFERCSDVKLGPPIS